MADWYVRVTNGSDSNGGASHADAFQTMQEAVDSATQADQINLCDEAAEVLAAEINFSAFTSGSGHLVVRGYTSARNDGGVGEIDGDDAVTRLFSTTSSPPMIFVDLKLHDTTGSVVEPPQDSHFVRCEVYGGATYHIQGSNYTTVVGCYIHGSGASGIALGHHAHALYNFIDGVSGDGIFIGGWHNTVAGNVLSDVTGDGIQVHGLANVVFGNTIEGDNSALDYAFRGLSTTKSLLFFNNICKDFGLVTGGAVDFMSGSQVLVGHNVLHGNRVNTYVNQNITGLDLTAQDQTTDPEFTDAASDDYSVGTNLRAKAFPFGALFGAANTTSFADIGAVQREEPAAGGGLLVHPGMDGGMNG